MIALGNKHRRISLQCFHLSVLALILRVIYLLQAISHLKLDGIAKYAPDTGVYYEIAEHFVSGRLIDSTFLIHVGPGYGFLLAMIQVVFGPNPLYAIGLNIFLGSIAAALIYLIAYQLTRSLVVAFIAGLICALSPTSITLSCNILSDQPFFTFAASAVLCFIYGYRTGGKKYFIIAGLLAGLAAYIRAIGEFLPLILILVPLVIALPHWSRSLWFMLKRTALTFIIALLCIMAWSGRNYIVHDLFVFGTNGVNTASTYLAARAMAEHDDNVTIGSFRQDMSREMIEYFGGHLPTVAENYQFTRKKLIEIIQTHPRWIIDTFWTTVKENTRAGNFIPLNQIPSFEKTWWSLIIACQDWLYLWIIGLAVLGWLFLIIDKHHMAWILLGTIYIYFTLITGFSYWQGSRLHYPAEMAWSILIAYALYRIIVSYIRLTNIIDQHFGISTRVSSLIGRFVPGSMRF